MHISQRLPIPNRPRKRCLISLIVFCKHFFLFLLNNTSFRALCIDLHSSDTCKQRRVNAYFAALAANDKL